MKKITVRVKPRSKKGPLVQPAADGSFVIYVRERALEGKANEAVIKLLAQYFSVAKTRLKITRGQSSKTKTVEID